MTFTCPLPLTKHKTIVMGHGSGGRLSAQLVRELFLPAFDNDAYFNDRGASFSSPCPQSCGHASVGL